MKNKIRIKQDLKAEREGLKVRKENFENQINHLEKEIERAKEKSPLTEEQQEQIRHKLNEITKILGMDNETFMLYKMRELETSKTILFGVNKKIESINERLKEK